ncbi:hypothetical protein PPACK8108_LOCUS22849 [Phakopsora pachyrhizi]|uniref:Uncharacterized protein n=1 Tax=Phakopsora pachyrhizi TaxID=170000 RepID=A0AAV0BQU4_PHAPC|nr:hypothetical protein PPACK8108_LOCUS22849 [Phakopsora pachyrhizi]
MCMGCGMVEALGNQVKIGPRNLVQSKLFAMMTHTKRSYIDVNELSLLLSYEEGETISWTLNEPNKGCNKTYGIVAEAWQEFAWEIHKATSDLHIDDVVQLEKYKAKHWRGFSSRAIFLQLIFSCCKSSCIELGAHSL